MRSTKFEMSTETQPEHETCTASRWLAAGALAIVGFGVLSALALYRHDTFRSNALDLGYLDQVVWNTAHGELFANSIKGENWPSYLAGHFAPAIAVLAPLYWVWDDVRMLLLVQAAILVSAGLPLFALFRDHGQRLALAALAAFLLNPWLHRANLHDFHTVLLAAPLISTAVYGAIRKRFTLIGAVLMALLLVKEDMGLVVALFGLYLLLFERQRAWRWGVLLLILGLAWVALAVLVLIPSFATSGEYQILTFHYAFLGSSPTDAIQTVLRDPLVLIRQVLHRDKILALVGLLASTAFLPLLGGALLVIALPLVWCLQLSDSEGLALLRQWHMAVYLPIFFGAICVGLGKVREQWRAVAVGVLLFVSAAAFILDGSVIQLLQDPGMLPERRQVVRQLMAQIPPEASVSAQDELLPHLSHRQEVFLFPTIEKADYVLMDRLGSTYPLEGEDYEIFWEAAQDPFAYERVYDGHGFLLLRRQTP